MVLSHRSLALLTARSRPFSSPDWLYELKWDGYRVLALVGDVVRLVSRQGRDMTGAFPEVAAAVGKLAARHGASTASWSFSTTKASRLSPTSPARGGRRHVSAQIPEVTQPPAPNCPSPRSASCATAMLSRRGWREQPRI